MLDLVMQPTQHPLAGFAVVVLNEVHIQAGRLLKVSLVEAFEEEAAVITKDLGLQNQHFGQCGWLHYVGHRSAHFSRLSRYCP